MLMGNMFHPDLLPESSDPEGSKRYEATIFVNCFPAEKEGIKNIDLIATNKLFIIQLYGPEYKKITAEVFDGVVLKEKNGGYSWWRHLKAKYRYPLIKYED